MMANITKITKIIQEVLTQTMNIGQFVAAEIIILLILSSVEKMIVSLETVYDLLTAVEKIGQD